MQILFVDESGTPPPPNSKNGYDYFVLGGVAIPEETWPNLAKDLRETKEKYNVLGEVKWRNFAPARPGSKEHPLSHLTATEKEAFRAELYAKLTAHKDIKLICVITDVKAAYRLHYINTADELYQITYKQLTERFQYYLQDLEKAAGKRVYGIVVCDHRAPRDDERLRELHHTLMHSQRANISRYDRLIEGLFIAPSHLSVGIQFADMVAGAVFRRIQYDDSRFVKMIAGSFRRSSTGDINGYGVVRFPKR